MIPYSSSFDLLGDPTRRRVLELLRGGPRSVGELADRLPVSRPAVSQHLRALRDAGLVTYTVEGTRHVYAVDRARIAELRAWFDAFWDVALDVREYAAAAAAARAAPEDEVRVSGPPTASPTEERLPTDKAKKRGKRKRKKARKERG